MKYSIALLSAAVLGMAASSMKIQTMTQQRQSEAALRAVAAYTMKPQDYGVLTAEISEAKPVRFGALKSWLSNG